LSELRAGSHACRKSARGATRARCSSCSGRTRFASRRARWPHRLLDCAGRTQWVSRRASRLHRAFAVALLGWLAATGSGSADSKPAAQGLDDQVQEVKSDVLAIATELQQLEEKLLFPSNTQLAVFVSLAEGQALELDSLQIRIDGERVAHHVYEFKELGALRKGGVQRIYTGNISTGEHRMEVSMAGTLPGGAEFDETGSYAFRKDVEPKIIDLTLTGGSIGGAQIAFGAE
jgi:hypothetical protein